VLGTAFAKQRPQLKIPGTFVSRPTMPAFAKQRPQLKIPGTFVSRRTAERREDKKDMRELKLKISKWKQAKWMRRQMIGHNFISTAHAVAKTMPGYTYLDFMEAREEKYKGFLRKAIDAYVTSKVEAMYGAHALVNPEKLELEDAESETVCDAYS